MVVYFATQQDIDVSGAIALGGRGSSKEVGGDGAEQGREERFQQRDDRRRRTALRLKCLYVVSGCSLFSLVVIVGIVHVESLAVPGWDSSWKGVRARYEGAIGGGGGGGT